MSKSTARGIEHQVDRLEQLRQEHQLLEKRLTLLQRPRSRSPKEAAEIRGIKKKKLAIKDQIFALKRV